MLPALPPGQLNVTQESSHGILARHRSLCGPGALAFLRDIPSDPARVIPPMEFVSTLGHIIGFDTFLARCRGTRCLAWANSTRHIRRCPWAGGQTTVHKYVKHRFVRCLHDMGVSLTVKDASPMSTGSGTPLSQSDRCRTRQDRNTEITACWPTSPSPTYTLAYTCGMVSYPAAPSTELPPATLRRPKEYTTRTSNAQRSMRRAIKSYR